MSAVAVAVVLVGCASSNGVVTRNGTREVNGQGQPEITGDALTLVPPRDRQLAPVVSGPDLMREGKAVSTANYAGKVIVLNVWGSWCGPCRKEAPDLAAAHKKTTKIAAFVGLNVRDYSADSARAFVRAFEIKYPHIYDPNGEQLLKFGGTLPPNAIPSTVIIDREGRIAARIIGVVSTDTLVAVVRDTADGR